MVDMELLDKGTCYSYYCGTRTKIVVSQNEDEKRELIENNCTHCSRFKPNSLNSIGIKIQEYADTEHAKIDAEFKNILDVMGNIKNIIGKDKETTNRLHEALTMLYRYVIIHTVEGVIYPEGTHTEWIEKARQILNEMDGEK